jgi:hypothetical protein
MEYQQASSEASAVLAALAANPKFVPEAGAYPMLEASIGIDGETLIEVATKVSSMHVNWTPIGASIRSSRLRAKAAIDAAATIEDAQAVLSSIVW